MLDVIAGGTFPVEVFGLLLAVFLPAEAVAAPQFAVYLQDGTARYGHAPATCAFGKCVWNDVEAGRPISVPADLVDLSKTQTGGMGSKGRSGSFTFASAAEEGAPLMEPAEATSVRPVSAQEPALLHVQQVHQVIPVYVPEEEPQPQGRAYGREGLRLLIALNDAKREVRDAEMAVLTSSVNVSRARCLVSYLKAADRWDRAEWRLAIARAKLARAEAAWERGRGRQVAKGDRREIRAMGHRIRGVWADPAKLESGSGGYVIWCKSGAVWTVLDIGESDDEKEHVLKHQQRDIWSRSCCGAVHYSAIYTPDLRQSGRKEIEQDIRQRVSFAQGSIICDEGLDQMREEVLVGLDALADGLSGLRMLEGVDCQSIQHSRPASDAAG